jgi:hypothetical protein
MTLTASATAFAPAQTASSWSAALAAASWPEADIGSGVSSTVESTSPLPKESNQLQTSSPRKGSVMSQSLPFLVCPSALADCNELAGNVGFDPLGLAKNKEQLWEFREAEIKHARLAMLVCQQSAIVVGLIIYVYFVWVHVASYSGWLFFVRPRLGIPYPNCMIGRLRNTLTCRHWSMVPTGHLHF